jgi:hypothetical protein
MNHRFEAISRLIAAVARQEDQELRPLGRGIAFVPELAWSSILPHRAKPFERKFGPSMNTNTTGCSVALCSLNS